jgi:hypothetical protein
VRVTTVTFGSSAWGKVFAGDVLVSLDGTQVYDDGTVPFRAGERVLMNYLVDRRQIGETLSLGVLRAGRPLKIPVVLGAQKTLVEGPSYGVPPSYFVYAGLVFTPLSWNYLATWNYDDVPTDLKALLELGLPSPERRQAIVLSHVLPDAVNEGYHDFRSLVIGSINGRPIGDMKDVIDAFKRPKGAYHVIELDREAQLGELVVLDAQRAAKANAEIIKRYNLPADRSADLR